jgi:hypothetical protein
MVSFNYNGKLLATAGYDGIVRVWDASPAALAPLLSRAASAAAAASRSGKSKDLSVASAAGAGPIVNDADAEDVCEAEEEAEADVAVPSLPLLYELEGPGSEVEWIQWHPKGDVLLAGSTDATAWMWHAPHYTPKTKGAPLKHAECMAVFAGHEADVTCGAFAGGAGKAVVTGSADGSVRQWNPRTGVCTHTFAAGEHQWFDEAAAINTLATAVDVRTGDAFIFRLILLFAFSVHSSYLLSLIHSFCVCVCVCRSRCCSWEGRTARRGWRTWLRARSSAASRTASRSRTTRSTRTARGRAQAAAGRPATTTRRRTARRPWR